MFFITLGILVGIGLTIWMMVDLLELGFDGELLILGLVALVGFCLIGFMGGAGVAAVVGMFPEKQLVESGRTELVALKDSQGIEGNFFLGSGQVNSEMFYFFYYSCGNSCSVFGKIPAFNARVYEDSESPHIKYFKKVFKNQAWNNFALPSLGDNETSEIHIPKGSIKQGFSLDLQ